MNGTPFLEDHGDLAMGIAGVFTWLVEAILVLTKSPWLPKY